MLISGDKLQSSQHYLSYKYWQKWSQQYSALLLWYPAAEKEQGKEKNWKQKQKDKAGREKDGGVIDKFPRIYI